MKIVRDVFITGVGMTQFARHMDKSIKDLSRIALDRAIADAEVRLSDIESVWFSNSGWGFSFGQDCIRGEVALRPAGLEGIPVTNVENACAGGSTALHHAWLEVASGQYECVLAIGAEKGYLEDKEKMFKGFWAGFDVENAAEHIRMLQKVSDGIKLADDPGSAGKDRSAFMDIYSAFCRWHMERYGTTQKQVAVIASKDHFHGSMNPYAQFQKRMSVEDILTARLVSWPLTVPMCAPDRRRRGRVHPLLAGLSEAAEKCASGENPRVRSGNGHQQASGGRRPGHRHPAFAQSV